MSGSRLPTSSRGRLAARFDVVFFSAWLSHVPVSQFEQFWQLLRGLLAEGGRVLFIDEPVDNRGKETYLPGSDEIVERQLLDGSRYHIVKNFVDPERLERRLNGLGWECRIRHDYSDWVWVCGEARPWHTGDRSSPASTARSTLRGAR